MHVQGSISKTPGHIISQLSTYYTLKSMQDWKASYFIYVEKHEDKWTRPLPSSALDVLHHHWFTSTSNTVLQMGVVWFTRQQKELELRVELSINRLSHDLNCTNLEPRAIPSNRPAFRGTVPIFGPKFASVLLFYHSVLLFTAFLGTNLSLDLIIFSCFYQICKNVPLVDQKSRFFRDFVPLFASGRLVGMSLL